jgi:hypothetical protein
MLSSLALILTTLFAAWRQRHDRPKTDSTDRATALEADDSVSQ